jgi:Zn-dependent alcohol dehydrogenase
MSTSHEVVARGAVCRVQGEPLVIEDVTVAPPGPDEVRVQIEFCAVCHSDISYAAGAWGGQTPAIYGHEAAGVIESVGEGVTGFEPGEHVVVGLLRSCGRCYHCLRGEENLCAGSFPDLSPFRDAAGVGVVRGLRTGAFASYTVVHRSQVVPIAGPIPLPQASLLACGVLTGFGAVTNTAAMPAGSTVAVIGAGGVGIGAIQGAAVSEASRVIAIDIDDAKLERARSFGATEVVNGAAPDAPEQVRAWCSDVGPDYVFVTVGVGAAVHQALAMVRRGGTVVLVGMPASGVMTEFETAEFADASVTIRGSKMGSARMSVDVPKLMQLYLDGRLDLDGMVSNIYPLAKINDAIAEARSGSVIRNVIAFPV